MPIEQRTPPIVKGPNGHSKSLLNFSHPSHIVESQGSAKQPAADHTFVVVERFGLLGNMEIDKMRDALDCSGCRLHRLKDGHLWKKGGMHLNKIRVCTRIKWRCYIIFQLAAGCSSRVCRQDGDVLTSPHFPCPSICYFNDVKTKSWAFCPSAVGVELRHWKVFERCPAGVQRCSPRREVHYPHFAPKSPGHTPLFPSHLIDCLTYADLRGIHVYHCVNIILSGPCFE